MTTLEISLPDEVTRVMNSFSIPQEKFVLEAIQEKIEREKNANLDALLREGYQATFHEDLALAQGI